MLFDYVYLPSTFIVEGYLYHKDKNNALNINSYWDKSIFYYRVQSKLSM